MAPLDFKQNQLNVSAQNGVSNPAKLDRYGEEKNVMTEDALNCLKHTCNISNSNLIRNADGLLCRRKEDVLDRLERAKLGLHHRNLKFLINF